MTTYLTYLSCYLVCRWDQEESPETSRLLDGLAHLTENQLDYLEEIMWKTYPA